MEAANAACEDHLRYRRPTVGNGNALVVDVRDASEQRRSHGQGSRAPSHVSRGMLESAPIPIPAHDKNFAKETVHLILAARRARAPPAASCSRTWAMTGSITPALKDWAEAGAAVDRPGA